MKELISRPQGDNKKEIEKAEQMMKEVQAALDDVTAKLTAQVQLHFPTMPMCDFVSLFVSFVCLQGMCE